MNIFNLKTIKEIAILSYKDQIRRVRKWGDKKLADKMEKMTIKVTKI